MGEGEIGREVEWATLILVDGEIGSPPGGQGWVLIRN